MRPSLGPELISTTNYSAATNNTGAHRAPSWWDTDLDTGCLAGGCLFSAQEKQTLCGQHRPCGAHP